MAQIIDHLANVTLTGATFDYIRFSPSTFAELVNEFISAGSQRGRISQTDLTVFLVPTAEEEAATPEGEPAALDQANVTLRRLLNAGTRIFDALLYLALPPEERFLPAVPDEGMVVPTDVAIASALFFVYFNLLTQARTPAQGVTIAHFLTGVMGLNEPAEDYIARVASFDLTRMNHSWIRHITLPHVGIESRNRFALGVAGYRLPSAVLYDTPNAVYRQDLNMTAARFEEHKHRAIEVRNLISDWIATGLHWYAHPLCRSPIFITRFKSMNKACADMLCFLFDIETLNRMVVQRVLFEMPPPNPRNRNWLTWTPEMFQFAPEPIIETDIEPQPGGGAHVMLIQPGQ